jgi:anti-sigma regulatory factor (Ser/Thr protein kinase)
MSAQAHPQVPAAPRTFSHRFSSTRRGARLARLLVLQQLDTWGFRYYSETSDAAAGIVAELASNAVTHGRVPGRDFEVRLTFNPGTLRIEVADTRTEGRPPAGRTPSAPSPDSETGRGLFLVAALAARWGVAEREGPGKTVWADLDIRPPDRTQTGMTAMPWSGPLKSSGFRV